MSLMLPGCLRASLLFLLLLGGCKADVPEFKPPDKPDAGPKQLEAPRLASGLPVRTSLSSIAVRGTVKGSSVVVNGSGPAVIGTPLPSGDFCVDVPLQLNASVTLTISCLGDGLISAPVRHQVAQDPTAPPPPDPHCTRPPCGGAPCPTTETNCTDGNDEDLDGWTDLCDLDCSACVDDYFAPNSYPANVPIIPKGSHDLKICPCHDDWFAFQVAAGGRVDAKATFDSSITIAMKLFRAEDAEDGGYKSKVPIKSSSSYTGSASIYQTLTKAGTYYLWVYPTVAKKSGSYRLIIY